MPVVTPAARFAVRALFWVVFVAIPNGSLAGGDGPPVVVHLLDGKSLEGTWVNLQGDGLSLRSINAQTLETIAHSSLLRIDFQPAVGQSQDMPPLRVLMSDGSRIAATSIESDGREVTVSASERPSFKCPATELVGILFAKVTDAEAARWYSLAAETRATDILTVVKNEKPFDLEGIIGSIREDGLDFILDGDTLPVKRERIRAALFANRGRRPVDAAVIEVIDRSGSRWNVERVESKGDQLDLVRGDERWSIPFQQVRRIDYSRGRLVFLSDLEPVLTQHFPFFDVAWSVGRDVSLLNRPLRLGDRVFTKGLAVHSRTSLTYELDTPYRRLDGLVGIDADAGPLGDAVVVIRGDDRELLKARIRAGEPPLSMNVPLDGVKRVTLVADFGERFDLGDHVLWADARLVK